MQDDPRNDPEEALRLIKALRLPLDILASDDADDEARKQVKCENKAKAKVREGEAERIAQGRYFIDEAARAIARQRGLDGLWALNFRDSMVKAAALGVLTVRDPLTWLPILTGQRVSLACIVTHDDVNLWLAAQRVGYQWEFEPEMQTVTTTEAGHVSTIRQTRAEHATDLAKKMERQAKGYYTVCEAAEILAPIVGMPASEYRRTVLHPAICSREGLIYTIPAVLFRIGMESRAI